MVQEHGRRIMRMAEQEAEADMILVDSGSNLGVVNRSILPAADYIAFPHGGSEQPRCRFKGLERPVAEAFGGVENRPGKESIF